MKILKLKTVPYIIKAIDNFECTVFHVNGCKVRKHIINKDSIFWSCKVVDKNNRPYVTLFNTSLIAFFEPENINILKENMKILSYQSMTPCNIKKYTFANFKLK